MPKICVSISAVTNPYLTKDGKLRVSTIKALNAKIGKFVESNYDMDGNVKRGKVKADWTGPAYLMDTGKMLNSNDPRTRNIPDANLFRAATKLPAELKKQQSLVISAFKKAYTKSSKDRLDQAAERDARFAAFTKALEQLPEEIKLLPKTTPTVKLLAKAAIKEWRAAVDLLMLSKQSIN